MSNDYKSILDRLLARVDNTLDKRQGSIIYDALAPAAIELAQCYADLEIYKEQTYLGTAVGENLDNRVADYGLSRNPATAATAVVEIRNTNNELYDIDIGSRFSIPEEFGGYDFTLIEKMETGFFKAVCDTPGTVGNEYEGVLLPLYNIPHLGKAEIAYIYKLGVDTETDEALRARAIHSLSRDAFGGNVSDYRRYLATIAGIGPVRIVPIWNGGGTVLILFLNPDYTPPSHTFVEEVQDLIDPIQSHGEGLGLAPIGHSVTVQAPPIYSLTISMDLEFASDLPVSIDDIMEKVRTRIVDYIKALGKDWEYASSITVYVVKIMALILDIDGVADVHNFLLNGGTSNIVIQPDASGILSFPAIQASNISIDIWIGGM